MANQLVHVTLVLEFDTWEPMKKVADRELDEMLAQIRTGKLLGHIGNFHMDMKETARG